MSADELTPTELAAFDQGWQATSHTLNKLIASYRQMTGDGEAAREVDLILFGTALPDTTSPRAMGMLLAAAIARLAEATP